MTLVEPAPTLTDEVGHPEAQPSTAKPSLQRWAVTSGSVFLLLTVVVVTTVIAANGGGFASIGAGILVAGFDGFPFGAMIGVMTYYMKYPEVG
jgi:hypothetical protein